MTMKPAPVNQNSQQTNTPRHVSTSGSYSNAATTDIIRVSASRS